MSDRCCEGMDFAVDGGYIDVRFRQEVFTVDGKKGVKLVPFYALRGAKKKQPAMIINNCPMCGASVSAAITAQTEESEK